MFVKNTGNVGIGYTCTLLPSLKRACAEMQRPTLADVFIFIQPPAVTHRQSESITLAATFGGFFPRMSDTLIPTGVCACVGESKSIKREEET